MKSRSRRLVPALLLAACALVLGGCVYLRLLQLKRQLAEFDRYFETDLRDGLKLTFKEPVLLDGDIENFFKWKPESRQRAGAAERWHFRWVKDRVAADGATPPYELQVDLLFAEHQLTKIILPEPFFVFIPKRFVLAGLRSLGHASVDQAKRTARAAMQESGATDPGARPLTQASLSGLIGAPNEIKGDAIAPRWCYGFAAASPEQKLGRSGRIDMTFTLEAATGKVRRIQGGFVTGMIDLGLTDEAAPVKEEVKVEPGGK
ncbi:MAG: hypothetical protein EXS32_04745 [Opitutus sp.]|nr:hypothetical protein [Opitutus sp.]